MATSSWDEKTKRQFLLQLIKEIALKEPDQKVEVPEDLQGFGTIEIDESKCILCGACSRVCEESAMILDKKIDLKRLLNISSDSTAKNRIELSNLIKKLMKKEPEKEIIIPEDLKGMGTPVYDLVKCVACNKCVEICEHDVLKLIKEWDLPKIFKDEKEVIKIDN